MKKVLIVDNNRTIVEMLADGLTDEGYQVSKAYDGISALEALNKETPDLIVLDLIMPKIDGYRLAKYLKADPNHQNIPIIILTGVAAEEHGEMFHVDADAIIAKGNMKDTLVYLLSTIKTIESNQKPKKGILGLDKIYPREMTKELLIVKQHFDSMLQAIDEGILEMDEHHRILFANEAACKLLEHCEIDLFSKNVFSLFPKNKELVESMNKLPRGGKIKKPGLLVNCGPKTIRFLATPFFFRKSYIGSIAVLEDITSQAKKQAALEELTSSIIKNAPIGICLIDGSHQIVLTNNSFCRLAHSRGDLKNRALLKVGVFKSEAFSGLFQCLDSIKPGNPASREITFALDRGRKMKTYHIISMPLVQQNGLPFYLLLVEDVTEKAQLERELIATNLELESANQAKSNFLSIVSHELRTPLSVIRGFLSLILDGRIPGVSGEALEALKTADKRSKHLQHLIEELLDLSRIEAGKITINDEIISIEKHILEVLTMFSGEIENKNLKVKANLPETLPEIAADHDKIHQIFTNLISNAVKFTPDGGMITLTGKRAYDGLLISIKDTGIGIPPGKLPLIFNKFYQVDSSNTRHHSGTGLGLSIVKMILEAMKGDISVKSEPGKGTTFTVFFPRGSVDDLEKKVAKPRKDAAGRALKKKQARKTILVCEDDEDTIEIIRRLLSEGNYEVIIRQGCIKALEEIYNNSIDLVILDIRMPGMNGYDFCRILKATERTRGIPVIILSAAGQEEEIRIGYETGASDYIIKPFALDSLVSSIEKHLAR